MPYCTTTAMAPTNPNLISSEFFIHAEGSEQYTAKPLIYQPSFLTLHINNNYEC